MIELSGSRGRPLAHGLCRRHVQHAVDPAGADARGNGSADYVSAFGDDPFSHGQIGHSSPTTASARRRARSSPARGPASTPSRLTGAERSFTYWRADAAARQLAVGPRGIGRKALKIGLLSTFPESLWQFWTRQPAPSCWTRSRRAPGQGARIAFDPNYRPRLWPDAASARAAIDAALRTVDIALPTFPDEQALFGDADARRDRKAPGRLGRHRDRRQEWRGARAGRMPAARDIDVPAMSVTDARRHDRRRRQLQRRLSRRPAGRRRARRQPRSAPTALPAP